MITVALALLAAVQLSNSSYQHQLITLKPLFFTGQGCEYQVNTLILIHLCNQRNLSASTDHTYASISKEIQLPSNSSIILTNSYPIFRIQVSMESGYNKLFSCSPNIQGIITNSFKSFFLQNISAVK